MLPPVTITVPGPLHRAGIAVVIVVRFDVTFLLIGRTAFASTYYHYCSWTSSSSSNSNVDTIELLLLLQFLDLFMELVPRITLKPLVKVFPCFKTITMSLVEKVRGTRYCSGREQMCTPVRLREYASGSGRGHM